MQKVVFYKLFFFLSLASVSFLFIDKLLIHFAYSIYVAANYLEKNL